MFAQTLRLQYWKSEHNENTYEDASGEDIAQGLFVVADGVGTSVFASIWANLLVNYFLETPLMSDDPFEVEWWVRLAQEKFKQKIPELKKMEWNVQQKVLQYASYSTLAALRITELHDLFVNAQLLAFGDSCIIIGKSRNEEVQSFPIENVSQFDLPPICVPSKLSVFNRKFHRCITRNVILEPGDRVILATDAVARWLVGNGGGRFSNQWNAFQEVANKQTEAQWQAFIEDCRAKNEMLDDDSTALILTLKEDFQPEELLGATTKHRNEVLKRRKKDFEKAVEVQNKELMAIYFGDGIDLRSLDVNTPNAQIEQARSVAEALREVLWVVREELESPEFASKVGVIWQKYGDMLKNEICAETLRQTLIRRGVSIESTESDSLKGYQNA